MCVSVSVRVCERAGERESGGSAKGAQLIDEVLCV